ncbi:MAG: EAL domain-containing protein [Candidatus Competibacteraceae bacterium]|nr:MAG: EAL domain-containing protein [Candidatus Competibacteraceae bacterium]
MDDSPPRVAGPPATIRFRIAAIVVVLLAITVVLTGYAYFALSHLQRQTRDLASVYLSDVALARHLQTRAEEMLLYLPTLTSTVQENGRHDSQWALNQRVWELREDITALEARNSLAPQQRGQLAELLRKLEMIEHELGQLNTLVSARSTAAASRKAGWKQVETTHARHFAAATEVEAQLRAQVARALAVDIAEAGPGQLQQRLDDLLDKDLGWLATAQDIRTDSRGLLEIAKQMLNETEVENLARQQAEAEVVIRRLEVYQRLPAGDAVAALSAATTAYLATMHGGKALDALRRHELHLNKTVVQQAERIHWSLMATVEIASSLVDDLVAQASAQVSASARAVGDAQGVLLAVAALAILPTLFGVYQFVRRTVLIPIRKITQTMLIASQQVLDEPDALGRQYLDPELLRGDDEVAAMARALAHFQQAIAERDAALHASEIRLRLQQEAEERIRQIAYHDHLTGLPNRLSLRVRLEQALDRASCEKNSVAVLFIDMDRFKIINDTLGHRFGDGLLVEIAHRLERAVRQSDMVARLGGDEFVVVLERVENTDYVIYVTERIRAVLGQTYRIEGHELHSTPSIGIALSPNDGDAVDVLMKNADAAMYHAKASGRNNYQFFTVRMNEVVRERLSLENYLRQALDGQQFVLHFQPQFAAASGRASSVEALLRWMHPVEGLIAPAHFLPVADEIGVMSALDNWVLRQALAQLRRWRDAGMHITHMAVNVSLYQLQDERFPERLAQILADAHLAPGDLELELTETMAMENPQVIVTVLKRLRGMGVHLALDDFGTGFSSLSYLKLLPIRRLKLDRSLIEHIATERDDAVICQAVIDLAHTLGLEVVAEGVETREQLCRLLELDCDAFQGFLLGRPQAAEQMEHVLGAHATGWAEETGNGWREGRCCQPA